MIDKLKSEIFDIIRQQDGLKFQYAELEKIKQSKLIQLDRLEKEENVVQNR